MTLKPAAWMCRECSNDVGGVSEDGFCPYCHKSGSIEPLFTHADLVRVMEKGLRLCHVIGAGTRDEQAAAHVAEMLGEVEK